MDRLINYLISYEREYHTPHRDAVDPREEEFTGLRIAENLESFYGSPDDRIRRAYMRDAERLVNAGVAEFVETHDGTRMRAPRVSFVTVERYMQASRHGRYETTVVSFHRGSKVRRYETNPLRGNRISDESVRRAFVAQHIVMGNT